IMLGQPDGGVLLFTASKTGLVAQTDSPVYCASKGAVVMLAKALALDYAAPARGGGRGGIRVNALCPGIIGSPTPCPIPTPPGRRTPPRSRWDAWARPRSAPPPRCGSSPPRPPSSPAS